MGKPLFQRTAKGVILTEEGTYLKQVCEPVVDHFDHMLADLDHQFHEQKETLLLGLDPFVLQASSADLIFRFRTTYPKYLVKATECTDLVCEQDVMDERIELAFCPRPGDNPMLTYIPIGNEPLYAVIYRSSPLASRSQVTPSDLKHEKLLSLNKYYQIHRIFLRCCQNCGFIPEFVVESGEIGTLLGLVKLNQGTLICMRHLAMDIDHSCCIAVPLMDDCAVWEYGLIYRKSRKLKRCTDRFIDFVKKNVE